ncbi:MAG: MFS transporter [Gammaproteobacteria bacterium]
MHDDAFRESLRLLGTRRFGTFWFASLLSSIGTWAQQVAEPWLLLSLGASPFLLGLDSFAMGAPVFVLTLLGGVLADRADRRHVIALFQSIQMLCPTLIVVLLLAGTIQTLGRDPAFAGRWDHRRALHAVVSDDRSVHRHA